VGNVWLIPIGSQPDHRVAHLRKRVDETPGRPESLTGPCAWNRHRIVTWAGPWCASHSSPSGGVPVDKLWEACATGLETTGVHRFVHWPGRRRPALRGGNGGRPKRTPYFSGVCACVAPRASA